VLVKEVYCVPVSQQPGGSSGFGMQQQQQQQQQHQGFSHVPSGGFSQQPASSGHFPLPVCTLALSLN